MYQPKQLFNVIAVLSAREAKKESGNRKLVQLFVRAFEVLPLLFTQTKLFKKEKQALYKLIELLYEYGSNYTIDHPKERQEYYKKHGYSKVDYTLARELVMGFPGHSFEFLKQVVNHYYYDSFLVKTALDQLIALDPIKGLYVAMNQTHSFDDESRSERVRYYFSELKKHSDNPGFTFDAVGNICGNSMIPYDVKREMAELVVKKKMLREASEEDKKFYTFYIRDIILPAKDQADYDHRWKKHIAQVTKEVEAERKRLFNFIPKWQISELRLENNFNNEHPERKKGERFLANILTDYLCTYIPEAVSSGRTPGIDKYCKLIGKGKATKRNFNKLGFKSKRMGEVAYTKEGIVLASGVPVFISEAEFKKYVKIK